MPEDLVRANGMASATNLVVRRRFGDGGGGPVVALNAHGDVVPPGEGWTRDPYGAEVVDGWMYGRGAAVSKSDFATYTWALRALEASGAPLAGTVELHLTYDEEAGGEIGPGFLLEKGISRPDLALSAGFSYGVVTAHNGCLHLEVEVNGRSAHAAMPYTGVDALEAATAILGALYAWRKGLAGTVSEFAGIGSPQLTVGLIKGGINTNVVPDRITFRLDRRIIPEENPAAVEAELREVIAQRGRAVPRNADRGAPHPARRAAEPLPGGERLVEAFCRHASRDLGEPVAAKGVPLYTDARLYAARGHPDRALRRRPAHHRGGERAPRRRAPAARRSAQGHRGRGADLARAAGARKGCVTKGPVGSAVPRAPSPRRASRPVR